MARAEAGGYLLQTQRGGKVRLNSGEDMAAHVGHLVKVTGSFAAVSDAGQSDPAANITGTENTQKRSGREFRVERLEVLSPTCSVSPARKK